MKKQNSGRFGVAINDSLGVLVKNNPTNGCAGKKMKRKSAKTQSERAPEVYASADGTSAISS